MAKAPDRVEVLRTEDAMKEAVAILGPQLGTDGADLAEQLIDVRRFTRLNKLEIVSIAYFNRHENDWVKDFMGDYMNLKMSEEGHERSALIVEALKAVGGHRAESKKKQDDRNWLGRNVTRRNQGPDDQ
jgi:hypothetical protein